MSVTSQPGARELRLPIAPVDTHREARWLAVCEQLDEEPLAGRRTLLAILGAVVATLLAIAAIVPMPILAPGNVVVVTEAGERTLSFGRTAVLEQLLVDAGTPVRRGQVVAVVEDLALSGELAEVQARRAAALARVAQLEGLIRDPVPSPAAGGAAASVGSATDRALDAQRRATAARVAAGNAELESQRRLLEGLTEALGELREQLRLTREQVEMRRQLNAKGAGSRAAVLEMQRAAQAVAREMAEVAGRIAATRAGLAAAAARIREVLDDARARRGDELQPVLAELAGLDARLEALGKRLDARFLRAPLDGVVKSVSARPGETVREGAPIVVLVPAASSLRFDMEIAARYGPLVRPGQSARVAIAGLDPYRYGYLIGTVRQVSAASFIEPQRPPVFRLTLDIDPDQGPVDRLRPGLIGEGRIVLGERTGLDYLANSLVRVWDDALSEP